MRTYRASRLRVFFFFFGIKSSKICSCMLFEFLFFVILCVELSLFCFVFFLSYALNFQIGKDVGKLNGSVFVVKK